MLTDRDREIVEVLDRSGGLDVASIRLMFGFGHSVTYRRLARLEEYGMLRAARPFRNTPGLYLPTRRGLRELLGLEDVLVPAVSAGSYNHQVEVGRVVAQLHAHGVEWESSRITRRRQVEARADGDFVEARRYSLRLGRDRSHLPDALIWPSETARARRQPVAIEVELAQKSKRRLEEILSGYSTALDFCGVVYVCGPQCHGAVLRAIDRGCHQAVTRVTTLHQFGPGVDHPARSGRARQGMAPDGPSWMEDQLTPGPISALEESLGARIPESVPEPPDRQFGWT